MLSNAKWSVISAPVIMGIVLTLLLLKFDVADVFLAMLSGAIVGVLGLFLGLSKGMSSNDVLKMLFFSIVGSFASWVVFLLLAKMLTISLYGIAAMAYDLIAGLIGSATVVAIVVEKSVRNKISQLDGFSDHSI